MTLSGRLKAVRAVICDIDGVLTDGGIGYGGDGAEIKFFNVKDGHGLKMLQRAGLQVGFLSGRGSAANRFRAAELGIDFLVEQAKDKLAAFEKILAERNLKPEECLYVGDDVIDLPVMLRCGVAVAPADAVVEVLSRVHWTTRAAGGRGVMREVADAVIEAQGKKDELMQRYLR